MRLLLLVTGETGSGKTTLVRRLGGFGFNTLHTGEMVRRHFTAKKAAESDDPVSPPEAEKFIRQKVEDFIDDNCINTNPVLMAIEAVPRNAEQIGWMVELTRKYDMMVMALVLRAPLAVRQARVLNRDLSDPERMKLDDLKLRAEVDCCYVEGLISGLRQAVDHTLGWSFHEVSGAETISAGNSGEWTDTSISLMMSCALNFYREKSGVGRPGVMRMLDRLRAEVDEALNATTENHRREELADCLWFLLMAYHAAGITPEGLIRGFLSKTAVNQGRLAEGHHLSAQEVD